MGFEVKWTPEAIASFENVIDSIRENWSQKEVDSFKKKTNHIIELVMVQPKMYRYSDSKGIHIAIISKQTSVLYKITDCFLVILLFWDNRSNPVNNPFKE